MKVIVFLLLLITFVSAGKGKGTRGKKIDIDTFYVGKWAGIDPDDGANFVRHFIPVEGKENEYTVVGVIEWSLICALTFKGIEIDESTPPTFPLDDDGFPIVTPAYLRGVGYVDYETGYMKASMDFYCLGLEEPPLTGVEWTFEPTSRHGLAERPSIRFERPIWLTRESPEYGPFEYY